MHGDDIDEDHWPPFLTVAVAVKLLRQGRATIITGVILNHFRTSQNNALTLKNRVRPPLIAQAEENLYGEPIATLTWPLVWKKALGARDTVFETIGLS